MPEVLAGFLVVSVLGIGLTGQMIFLRRREESYLDMLEVRIRTMPDQPVFTEANLPFLARRKEAG